MDYPGKVITKTQVTPTQTSASGNWTLDDQAAAIKNNNWPVALVPNPISKSLRFNSADSAYLNRTLTTPTSGQKWTYSTWVKRGILTAGTGTAQMLLSAGSATGFFRFSTTDTLISGWTGASNLETTSVYRDPAAWYHIMLVVDTTQATAANRVKYYVNGVQITAFATTDYPTQNSTTVINSAVAHNIGAYQSSSQYFNGYMTEVNFIDGQALTPSSFGMTNPQTGQWIPLKYSGTYGTNGFYLNFKDATSTTTLGLDYSGNANNWTTNNFSVTAGAGNDSLTDVPTPWFAYNTTGDVGGVIRGNYCTLNPLQSPIAPTNGNLTVTGVGAHRNTLSTHYLPAVPVYIEAYPSTAQRFGFGIATASLTLTSIAVGQAAQKGMYSDSGGSGSIYDGTTLLYASLPAISGTQVWQLALDTTTGKGWLGLNNVWYDSSGGTTGNPSTGANPTWTGITSAYSPMLGTYDGVASNINFGQRSFAYTPPTGFRSLCTTNLPATAIGFGLTNQGDDYFNANLYTGTGSAFTLTGVGFQPDFGWFKGRNASSNHWLHDVVRGANPGLSSNSTAAEDTTAGQLTAFASDGYSLPNDTAGYLNFSGRTMVVWSWKASGSTVSNTAGTITSTVSANTTAGFSIVTYTGNGVDGATTGHGLGAVPNMVIVKRRDVISDWNTKHSSLSSNNVVFLNSTSAQQTPGSGYTGDLNSSTTITFKNGGSAITNVNGSGNTYVAYCFAPVLGYSAFGSYTGNGSTDGPFVYLGFRPKYIMQKRTDSTGTWELYDTVRDTYNVMSADLSANLSDAETSIARFDSLSNGFKVRTTGAATNASGGTYIYMAFAESPFQFSNAR